MCWPGHQGRRPALIEWCPQIAQPSYSESINPIRVNNWQSVVSHDWVYIWIDIHIWSQRSHWSTQQNYAQNEPSSTSAVVTLRQLALPRGMWTGLYTFTGLFIANSVTACTWIRRETQLTHAVTLSFVAVSRTKKWHKPNVSWRNRRMQLNCTVLNLKNQTVIDGFECTFVE